MANFLPKKRDERHFRYNWLCPIDKRAGLLLTADLEGWHRNTDLAVNLKTILHTDRRMKTGKDYQGVLRLDVECGRVNYNYSNYN